MIRTSSWPGSPEPGGIERQGLEDIVVGGLANITLTDVSGTAAHDTEASVGNDADLNLTGKLEVTADATTTATPSANRAGGGFGVDFGDTDITTIVDSDTSAWIGDGTDVERFVWSFCTMRRSKVRGIQRIIGLPPSAVNFPGLRLPPPNEVFPRGSSDGLRSTGSKPPSKAAPARQATSADAPDGGRARHRRLIGTAVMIDRAAVLAVDVGDAVGEEHVVRFQWHYPGAT